MEKDNYSHRRERNDWWRSKKFIKFHGSSTGRSYFFIRAAVVRLLDSSMDYSTGQNYIYKEHYLKGELVARYKQDDMAEYLMTDQSRISKNMTKLEEIGFIKKIERRFRKGRILYYQVGVWDGELDNKDSYHETMWADEIFNTWAKIAKQKRGEGKKAHVPKTLEEMTCCLDPKHPDFNRLNQEWKCK
jgi:predicted transcriptional regulator